MKELTINSTNNEDKLHVLVWEPTVEIKAIVQISHGMIEYVERYNHFAEFLNERGILVIGNDHLGHGKTAKEEDLGYFGPGKSQTVVDDLHAVTLYAKENYGINIPYFLLGHSMGSFMARRYIMTYGDELNGVILCGTGRQPAFILAAGKFVAFISQCICGERHRSKLIERLSLGSYNKKIDNPKSKNDWLSRDEKIVEKYNSDKYCTFSFTINGYQTLFDVLSFIQKKSNIAKIPKNLPIMMISGDKDPVGNFGKGVEMIYNTYLEIGIQDIELKLYQNSRHEILNEIDKLDVYHDVFNWILKYIK